VAGPVRTSNATSGHICGNGWFYRRRGRLRFLQSGGQPGYLLELNVADSLQLVLALDQLVHLTLSEGVHQSPHLHLLLQLALSLPQLHQFGLHLPLVNLVLNSVDDQCTGYKRRFGFDSTAVRRPFDCLSKIIKVTVTRAAAPPAAVTLTYLLCPRPW